MRCYTKHSWERFCSCGYSTRGHTPVLSIMSITRAKPDRVTQPTTNSCLMFISPLRLQQNLQRDLAL